MLAASSGTPQPQSQFLLFSNFITFTNGSHTHTHHSVVVQGSKSNINTHLIKSTLLMVKRTSILQTIQLCKKAEREHEWEHEA